MAQNSEFTIQLLEKIGAPLAAAIESVPLKGEDTESEAAKIMAQMLGMAVQISISLNAALNITEDEVQADSTRLALASLAAPLIGAFYRQNERVPDDQDIKRMVKSQEAVLAFAENFTPAKKGASRLSLIGGDTPLFDETQASLVVLQALTPVISAIAEFPFGQSEIKLLQEVTAKIQTSAADIAKVSGATDKLSELLVLKALAQIYADCHRAETARLSTASDDSRTELSLDPIWDAYDIKVAMIEAIAGNTATNTGAVAPQPVAAVLSDKPDQVENSPTVAEPSSETSDAPAPSGGPMGFFKGPKKEDSPSGTPDVAPVTETEVKSETSSEVKSEAQLEQSAPVASSEGESATPPSGPMGFFKPGVKKKDDETSSE